MNKSMKQIRNLFTYSILGIKSVVKEMQSARFYAILLVSVIFVGIFSLSPAISTLMNDVIIRSTGKIFSFATAESGSAEDIQAAVDEVAAVGGGFVYIPEGTFNFVEPGELWVTVQVPAVVSIFGAPTERTSGLSVPDRGMNPNGQVVEWKTVLVMPFEAPTNSAFFSVVGYGNPDKKTRFSDIKLVGYRDIDPESTTLYNSVVFNNVIDFRIDHCFFKHCTRGISILGAANGACCGVIDHCNLINEYGVPTPYAECTVGYGVMIRFMGSTRWEDDIDKVLGHYIEYTTFIEDCYFSRWRHCVSSNDGAHYVFRHNTIEKDCGYGSLDAHGTYDLVGTRCIEIYDNRIIDPVMAEYYNDNRPKTKDDSSWVVFWRGGGGVFFNNYIRTYYHVVQLTDEGTVEKCYPHEVYAWNNTLENVHDASVVTGTNGQQEGEDYFLYEKPGYTPYPYPHPLTLED